MMFLGQKGDTEFYLTVNGKIIPENKKVKLLSVAIDCKLNINSHMKDICGKVNQKTSALARLRDYISEKSQIITEYDRDFKFPVLFFNMIVL